MEHEYKVYLVNYHRSKKLTIKAPDAVEALKKVETDYPGWQVSMFWLVWP